MNLGLGARVYLDSNFFIYLVEGHPTLSVKLENLSRNFEKNTWQPVTSQLALAECLAKPLMEKNTFMEQKYRVLFEEMEGLIVRSITDEILMEAVNIRAQFRLALLDSIHGATAKTENCQVILSADKKFQRFDEVPVVGLFDLI